MRLDITTTAMARPELLDRTYKSFTEKLHGIDWNNSTLFINIDPYPENVDRMKCVEIANKYFKNVVYRLPKKANFTNAVNWLWSQAENDIILHLEDDWELLCYLDIKPLLEREGGLYQIPFRAYQYKYSTICLSPSLIHKHCYKAFAGKLDEDENPETQIHRRNKNWGIYVPSKDDLLPQRYVNPFPAKGVIVKDIGREWMAESEYTRPQLLDKNDERYKKKCHFTSWEKK